MELSVVHWFASGILIISLILSRILFVLPFFRLNESHKQDEQNIPDETIRKKIESLTNNKPLNAFIFLGSGGHTGEMLRLLQNFNEILLKSGAILHIGYSDDQSYQKFQNLVKGKKDINVQYYHFVKAREVNAGLLQSLISITKTLITSLIHIITIKYKMINKPHLVLLNGPGTCCIIALWFKIIDILLFFTSSNIIYVESLARINTLSMTGKILYLFADQFVVQWEELIQVAPRAKYFGILV
ncbi:UDP-N-acetylglucosamine transferase subunit [Maudiozyma exigua]|uniref:UDP-N-acetylglucosamine transferase subunit ALG14 n=1 Tax=Maudiozyma exigua TaxID=34358 RepID=A0A9P6WCS6_MAUEX|nr:UDP-N-acetylglucosamine transferase subunit [Kazachstania exigua]